MQIASTSQRNRCNKDFLIWTVVHAQVKQRSRSDENVHAQVGVGGRQVSLFGRLFCSSVAVGRLGFWIAGWVPVAPKLVPLFSPPFPSTNQDCFVVILVEV
jgi:hypothetical protein